MTDDARLIELRRRVQEDPASIAFAQVAEECRRSGATEEAVRICQAGLSRYPDYLSARVTLGRALLELGRLDEAQVELQIVVTAAPENLAGIRGLAEIFQRRGQMADALAYYQRALQLARHDRELEDTVERMSQTVTPPVEAHPPAAIEDLFNFDALVSQLGESAAPAAEPPVTKAPAMPAPSALDAVELRDDDADALAAMARQLEAREAQRAADEARLRRESETRRRDATLGELESWLSAILADRLQRSA